MARGVVTLGLVAAVVAAFVAAASAQSGCTTVLISMAPCLGFIQGNSSTPSSSCCTQLASVVQSQPRCLCQVLSGGAAPLGIVVNQTQALALPGACKVQTPPVSQCNAVAGAGPAASPTAAPAPASPATPSPAATSPSSPETPSTPATPASPSPAAGGGSKATPSAGGPSSGGSSNKMTLSIFFCALFLASYASTAGIF